jgi:hypothetical protein
MLVSDAGWESSHAAASLRFVAPFKIPTFQEILETREL